MRRIVRQPSLSFAKVLIYLGKPAFFLFTILSILVLAYFQLLTNFVRQIRRFHLPSLTFPSISLLLFIGLILIFYQLILKDLPSPRLLTDSPPSLSTNIYDRQGNLLYQIYKNENRSLIRLSDLPQHLIDATLAAEDKNFYHHPGLDFSGILRALYHNLLNCRIKIGTCSPQGGSTLTQQLVKNTLLTPEKTLVRKLKEAILALWTERLYSKDQILEMYLNKIPYGGTAYGIQEASRQYFGKNAGDLSLPESALLAGLPISPTTLSPFGTTPYLSKVRQTQVLENMVKMNTITENDKVAASGSPLNFKPSGISIRAPHFVMYVRDLLVKQFGESVVSRGGLKVTTTLDSSIQDLLQTEINHELTQLSNLHVGNGAGLIVEPQTGHILAMVGSRDFFDTESDGQVNLTLALRQPGSAIKPLTYSLAFLHGATPNTTIDDSPVCFRFSGQSDYCPKNYDGRFHGSITLRTALASSYNIPATKLLNSLGVNRLVELARNLGITTWNDPSRFGLSLTLGGGDVTMFDLTQVYSVFANSGNFVPLTPFLSITDSNNQPLPLNQKPIVEQVIPASVAFQISHILADPAARAPAFGYNSLLNIKNYSVAVKTGTTNNLRDNWTFGYTPNLLIATWVGNNDNSPMSSVASGITGASPIWARTMTQLLQGSDNIPFLQPPAVVKVNVSCQTPRYEYFVKGTEPKLDCSESGKIL